jgi:SAM-dependent methyltransferase
MAPSASGLLARVWHRLRLAPAGHGRPISSAAADAEYTTGAWSHFQTTPELARYLVLAGTIAELHPRATILDLGCGTGRLAQLLTPHQPRRLLGVDFSTEAVRRARELALPRCEFLTADFESWRPAEKFEVIVFNEVVGYARDPGALVAAFLPALTPGGHVLISYYRSGHWAAIWRRIERHVEPVETTTLTNARHQTWDLKVLRPRS